MQLCWSSDSSPIKSTGLCTSFRSRPAGTHKKQWETALLLPFALSYKDLTGPQINSCNTRTF